MKKSLIALAVLSVSGAAMAQSAVAMYGLADASLIKLQGQRAQMGSGSGSVMTNLDSRLGVKGTEDMGGGLKAGFDFQTRLSLETGAVIGKNAVAGVWSPMAKVWVGGDSWGTFMMGRTLTPSYYGVAAWELTGSANYSLIGKSYGWGGGANSRNDSQFGYKTPNFAGFTAELGYITKADVQNAGTTTFVPGGANGAKWDVNAIYKNGPITASVVANKVSKAANLNGSKVNWVIGGKYNFGSFIVAAGYHNTYNNNNNSNLAKSQLYAKRNGVTVGGTVLIGAFSFTADIGRDTKLQDAGGRSISKRTNVLLEGKYNLSKRTFIYLAGLRLDGTNNYGLGLQHNF
ncbi:MAG: porin [Burkholderiaceae bacterium]|jgi:predicted porin|nr:porin [Burkholderiaceae bacterium]